MESESVPNWDEGKLNNIYLIAPAFYGTYYRIVSEQSAVGVSPDFSFGHPGFYGFCVSLYYRRYFEKKELLFFMDEWGMEGLTILTQMIEMKIMLLAQDFH